MLNKDELLHWCQKLNLSQAARNVIEQVRTSDPARRVQSGTRNVSGSYPSKKMKCTIQFESHRVELADVYEMEYDDDVLEYYDQPPTFKLEYFSMNGRRQVVMHTPDYFAIREGTAGWDECKTEEKLEELSQKNPNRYCRGEDGEWRCPPGEAYAEQFNFYYRVRSSKTTNWVFQRNIQFLEDYLRVDQPQVDKSAREVVLALVAAEPSIKLEEVFLKTKAISLCIDQVSEGTMNRFACLIGKKKNTVWGWQHGKAKIPMDDLLRICFQARISVLDFLHTEFVADKGGQGTNPVMLLLPSTKPTRRRPRPFDRETVRRLLEEVLKEEPSSMKEVAVRLKIEKRFLYKHFSSLCRAISARYAKQRKTHRELAKTQRAKDFNQVATRLHANGIYPSRRRVAALVSRSVRLRTQSDPKHLEPKVRRLGAG